MSILQLVKTPYCSLAFNLLYAVGNGILGFSSHSWWMITAGAYYMILAITRFSILQIKRKAKGNYDAEQVAKRVTGILLIALSVCIMGINILSALKERGTTYHEIGMITIATYTFAKITVAIVGITKAKHVSSPALQTIRNIALADACVSVLSMQRSMLVSFPGMEETQIWILNVCTGSVVWLFVWLLGINLLGNRKIDAAKSKIANATRRITKATVYRCKSLCKGTRKVFTLPYKQWFKKK